MAAIDATLFATEILGLWTEASAGARRAMSAGLAPPRGRDLVERPPLGYDVFNTPE